jgi:hypothetical protein
VGVMRTVSLVACVLLFLSHAFADSAPSPGPTAGIGTQENSDLIKAARRRSDVYWGRDIKGSAVFQKRIGGGFLGFGLLSLFGLRLLWKGIRDDIYDWIGEKFAPRWSYVAFGIICQLPFVAFILFLFRQGLFDG